jgi:hypothetical protein
MATECCFASSPSSQLILTGQIGEVMQESVQTALSYLRSQVHAADGPFLIASLIATLIATFIASLIATSMASLVASLSGG